MWRGKPIFIRHRTKDEIDSAKNVTENELIHKASDDSRVENPKWLVVVGVCTTSWMCTFGTKNQGIIRVSSEVGSVLVMDPL